MPTARQHLRNAVDLADAGAQRLELRLARPQPFGSVNQLGHRLRKLSRLKRSDEHASEHGDDGQTDSHPQQQKQLQRSLLRSQPPAQSPEVVAGGPPEGHLHRQNNYSDREQDRRKSRPQQLTAHARGQPRSARSKRKPTPRTVEMKRGCAASSPSFRRSTEICMSRVLVDPNHTVSQISRISCSRETTLPCSRTRTLSRSNSLAVSCSSSSLKKARRASGSTRTTASAPTSLGWRRSSALTRASSSARRKGLVT